MYPASCTECGFTINISTNEAIIIECPECGEIYTVQAIISNKKYQTFKS